MTSKKSTRYALCAMLTLAEAPRGDLVPVARVAGRYGVPVAVLAKIFQQLARAGLVVGSRGTHGGYALARPAGELTVLDVILAFESPPSTGERPLDERLRRLFVEVDELARCTYASVTLETLAGRREVGSANGR